MNQCRNWHIYDIIWTELTHAKSWEQYISDYYGSRVDMRRYYNITSILVSLVGVLILNIPNINKYNWVIVIAFSISIIAQLLSALQKDVVVDNDTLLKMGKLRSMYIGYYDLLEKLFIQMVENNLSKDECEVRYYELRNEAYPIEVLKDELNFKEKKRLLKRTYARVDNMLNKKFNLPEDSDESVV